MSVAAWIQAARLRTLPAALAPVLIGLAIASREYPLEGGGAVGCLLLALLVQIGTNFANDYYDFCKGADTPARKGPVRVTQAGLISPGKVRGAMLLTFLATLGVGAFLTLDAGWPFGLICVLSVVAGYLYTGGPYPLGYLGLGDLFVLLFFGPVAVGGTYFIQAGTLPGHVLLAGVAPGLIATAILAVNNLRDADEDQGTGKRTLAVRFGKAFGRGEYLFCVATAAALPAILVTLGYPKPVLIASFTLLLALPVIRTVYTCNDGPRLNQALANTGKTLMAYALLFTFGMVL